MQRTTVSSLSSHHHQALSTLSTVLTAPPPRDPMSPFIIRSSSLTFHPREMVYAVGSLDGSGMCLFSATIDLELTHACFSACYGLQASVVIEDCLKKLLSWTSLLCFRICHVGTLLDIFPFLVHFCTNHAPYLIPPVLVTLLISPAFPHVPEIAFVLARHCHRRATPDLWAPK